MYDTVVVGGGPGGAVAARKCAQKGFRTLLVERKRMPRDKVCSGMIMGPWANDIIEKEFGKIPKEVLVSPYYLSGHLIHVPGVRPRMIKCKTPLAWRKDLDFWMIQKAQEAGVEVWDGAKVIQVNQKAGACNVKMIQHKKPQEIKARFVIGADGGASAVRKSLFPGLKVQFSVPTRECYKGTLDLEKDYFHWFFPKYRLRPRFGLNHKQDCFLIEGSGIKELKKEIIHILAKYGFNPERKALWKDGCLIPRLHEALISGNFSPAAGNVLLVGEMLMALDWRAGCRLKEEYHLQYRRPDLPRGDCLKDRVVVVFVTDDQPHVDARLGHHRGQDGLKAAAAKWH